MSTKHPDSAYHAATALEVRLTLGGRGSGGKGGGNGGCWRNASPGDRRDSSVPGATQSVTRVDVGIAGSGLPIAVSVIVAATGARIVAPAEGDADSDAKIRAS